MLSRCSSKYATDGSVHGASRSAEQVRDLDEQISAPETERTRPRVKRPADVAEKPQSGRSPIPAAPTTLNQLSSEQILHRRIQGDASCCDHTDNVGRGVS
jgi:hypothetical protein